MIRVDRSRVPAPSVLVDADGRGARERKRAAKHFTPVSTDTPRVDTKPFAFSAYKDDAVRIALEKLFHGKCAYCESYFGATQPVDVEHWRPKGSVHPEPWEARDAVHGYYWLASEWDNLLPSCIDCNRARRQTDASRGVAVVSGKGSRFPIEQRSVRATCSADLSAEQPLLLNPCVDEPNLHIECLDGDPSLVADRTPKGRASIEIYGLNRAGLVIARRERLFEIRHRIDQLRRALAARAATIEPRTLDILDSLIELELRELARLRRDDQPYALLGRRLIDRFIDELIRP